MAWEHKVAYPMVPPALLRTAGFARACAVYLLAYLASSGFIYYVTLFFQNIDRWLASWASWACDTSAASYASNAQQLM